MFDNLIVVRVTNKALRFITTKFNYECCAINEAHYLIKHESLISFILLSINPLTINRNFRQNYEDVKIRFVSLP